MKSSQNFFNEFEYYITPSEIIEFMYCNRFTYFMKCLSIRQYEEKRYKVQKGREVHEQKEVQNRAYLRKKLGAVDKLISVQVYSNQYKLRGIVDEILTLEDGSLAPLDYKFAEYEDIIYDTYKTQIILYGLMVEEMYGKIVNKGYVVYTRSKNQVVEIQISDKEKHEIKNIIRNYLDVINGYYPQKTKYSDRCIDCCYKNICIK